MARNREINRRRHKAKTRRKIYVASKYAGKTEENTRKALDCCRYVISNGGMPIASHILYAASGMLRDDDPDEREMGLSFGLALLAFCDEVWVFGDISPGMRREIEEAKRLDKPVIYKEDVV